MIVTCWVDVLFVLEVDILCGVSVGMSPHALAVHEVSGVALELCRIPVVMLSTSFGLLFSMMSVTSSLSDTVDKQLRRSHVREVETSQM